MENTKKKQVGEKSYYKCMTQIPDPRHARGIRHTLTLCLTLLMMGFLAGMNSIRGVGRYIHDPAREKELTVILDDYFDLKHGLPSYSTLTRLLEVVDKIDFVVFCFEWSYELLFGETDNIVWGIDGQAIRAAINKRLTGKSLYMVDYYSIAKNILLYMVEVGDKTNEAKSIAEEIADLVCEGDTVLTDAMGTKRDILTILKENKANSACPLKKNNPTLMTVFQSFLEMLERESSDRLDHYLDLNGLDGSQISGVIIPYEVTKESEDNPTIDGSESQPISALELFPNVYDDYIDVNSEDGIFLLGQTEGAGNSKPDAQVDAESEIEPEEREEDLPKEGEGDSDSDEQEPLQNDDLSSEEQPEALSEGDQILSAEGALDPAVNIHGDLPEFFYGDILGNLCPMTVQGVIHWDTPVPRRGTLLCQNCGYKPCGLYTGLFSDSAILSPITLNALLSGSYPALQFYSLGHPQLAVENIVSELPCGPFGGADDLSRQKKDAASSSDNPIGTVRDDIVGESPGSDCPPQQREVTPNNEASILNPKSKCKGFLINGFIIPLAPSRDRFERRETTLLKIPLKDMWDDIPEHLRDEWEDLIITVAMETRYRAVKIRVKDMPKLQWKVTVTRTMYSLNFIPESAKKIGDLIRDYWSVEGRLHYVVDTLLHGDRCTARIGNSPMNNALIRKMCFNTLSTIKNELHDRYGIEMDYKAVYEGLTGNHKEALKLLLGTPEEVFRAYAERYAPIDAA